MKRSIYHQVIGALTVAGEEKLVRKLQAAVENQTEKTPLQEQYAVEPEGSSKEKPVPLVEGASKGKKHSK